MTLGALVLLGAAVAAELPPTETPPTETPPTETPATDPAAAAPAAAGSAGGALPEWRKFRLRTVTFGVGGAVGAASVPPMIGDTWWMYYSGSPVFAATLELGRERVRWHLELETAPTFTFPMGSDVLSLDLVHVRTGVSFGGPDLRGGPTVFGGLLIAGAGGRLVWSPWVGPKGTRHGLDLRVDVLLEGGPNARLLALYAFTPWEVGR